MPGLPKKLALQIAARVSWHLMLCFQKERVLPKPEHVHGCSQIAMGVDGERKQGQVHL